MPEDETIARMLIEEYILSWHNYYIIIVWALGRSNVLSHIWPTWPGIQLIQISLPSGHHENHLIRVDSSLMVPWSVWDSWPPITRTSVPRLIILRTFWSECTLSRWSPLVLQNMSLECLVDPQQIPAILIYLAPNYGNRFDNSIYVHCIVPYCVFIVLTAFCLIHSFCSYWWDSLLFKYSWTVDHCALFWSWKCIPGIFYIYP
jgi:hypothetical protein